MANLTSVLRNNGLNRIYTEARLPAVIRRSLTLMLMGNVFGTMFGIICGGGTTAMVELANALGAGDFAYGMLNSIPQVAAIMQIPFAILVSRTQKRKKYIMTYGVFSRALWIIFGFLPLLLPVAPQWLPLFLLLFLLGISSFSGGAIQVCWFPWFSDLAPLSIRGRWLSIKDIAVSVANVLFGIVAAMMLDNLPERSKYMILFTIGGIVGVLDMCCYGLSHEVYLTPPQTIHVKPILKEMLHNRAFLMLTLMWTLWCFTANMCGPYLNRYVMNEMGLSAMQIMIYGTIAGSVSTIVMMPRWGRAVDHFGGKSVMMLCAAGNAVIDGIYLFSVPGSVVPMFLRNFLGAIFWSAMNLAATSMQLTCSPEENRPTYIALFSCITALVGTALGTSLGGVLLSGWEQAGTFVGYFDRYKALIALSITTRLAVALIMVPRMENDRQETVRDLCRAVIQPVKHLFGK